MFKKTIISLIILTASLPAWATRQTYKVTATVSQLYESSYGAVPATLRQGDEITMTYVMDDAKSPDYQDSSHIFYNFNQNDGSLTVAWANAEIKTAATGAAVRHDIYLDQNIGITYYGIESYGPFENTYAPYSYLGINSIRVYFVGPLQSQTYSPWQPPVIGNYSSRHINIDAGTYYIQADITSIVNESLTVWPGDGSMHATQYFDAFITAPEGYNSIELIDDFTSAPLPISCLIVPNNTSSDTSVKFLCRNLDATQLALPNPTSTGVTVRAANPSTGQTLNRTMHWKVIY